MNCHIAPFRGMGYSDLYLDFVSEKDSARRFFAAPSLEATAHALDQREFDRERLVRLLRAQNESFSAPEITLANIDRLADPQTLCVFSGQQAGLLTGPLLVQVKAIGIIKAAAEYSRQLKRPVVPVFWIAGDDHDFEEANHTFVLDRSGDIKKIEYASPPETALPTYQVKFEDAAEMERWKNALKEALGESDFTSELYDLIDHCYTSSDTMVSAFGKMMTALLGKHGLILFSPGDPEAKKIAAPFFETIVTQQDQIHAVIDRANAELLESGYHNQVEKAPESAHLFCVQDGRQPVLRDGDRFVIGDKSFSRDELIALIRNEPERFSPDVMTRPVLQSYLLPTLSQKGGPAEIAYLAQMNGLFELFELPAPYHRARPTATVIEARFADMIHDHHIEFRELTCDVEQLVNRILAETFPGDVEKGFAMLRRDVEYHVNKFKDESLQFDKGLTKFAEQTQGKIDFALKNLESKTFAVHKKSQGDSRNRIYRLYNALSTNRGLQERALNISYFISKYGLRFVDQLYDQIEPEIADHQLLDMREF